MEKKHDYTYASLKEVDEFFDGEYAEIEHSECGIGRDKTEITTWEGSGKKLRRVVHFGFEDWTEAYEWVSLKTLNPL